MLNLDFTYDILIVEETVIYIIEYKGSQLDPYIVDVFESNLDTVKKIMED